MLDGWRFDAHVRRDRRRDRGHLRRVPFVSEAARPAYRTLALGLVENVLNATHKLITPTPRNSSCALRDS
jgi:hypothetical protein